MKTIRIIFFLGLFIISFLSLPFLFFVNKKVAYYSYKEVVYRTIINNTVGKEKKPKTISLLLLDYFHYYLFTPFEAPAVDRDVYSDLIRGIASCDQRSWALGTFLGKVGIDNRMVMTRNPYGVSNHTVLEVSIGKKWRFFDPLYGFIIKDDNGKLASYEDICRHPSLFYLSPPMQMLRKIEPDKYPRVKDFFVSNIFYNKAGGPIIWKNPILGKDLRRKIVTKVLDYYIRLFGKNFSYFYQDVYLKYFSPKNKANCMFFKARNYDLFDRYQLAIEAYKNFIDNFPENTASEDALFFLGVLYHKTKNLESSINTIQILLREFPETKWRRISRYYLGYDYELLNNYELAKEYYWQAIGIYNESIGYSLMPGEMKIVRKLYDFLNNRKPIVGD